jgi:MFS family permease
LEGNVFDVFTFDVDMSTEVLEQTSLSSKEYTLFFVSVLAVMSTSTIASALPEIAKAFPEESELTVQLIITITALFTSIGALFVGNLIDKYGRRKLLILALIVYGISGSSGLYLSSINSIIIGRAIFGLAVAGIMTIPVTLIGDYYRGEFQNKVIGMRASFMTFGGVVFIFVGGLLADVNWHLPFGLYLIAFLFLFGVVFFIDEPKQESLTLSEKSTKDHEQSMKAHTKVLSFAYSIGFITIMMFYYILLFGPFYFVEKFNKSPTDVGLAFSINSLFAGFAAIFYKRLKAKYHYHALFGLLYVFMSTGFLLLSIASNFWIAMCALVPFGIGLGMFIPNINSWLFGQTHAPIRGRMMGGFTTAVFLGQFLSPITGKLILQRTDISGLFMTSAFVFILVAVLFFVNAYFAHRKDN